MGCMASLRGQATIASTSSGYIASFYNGQDGLGAVGPAWDQCSALNIGVRVVGPNAVSAPAGDYEICLTIPTQTDLASGNVTAFRVDDNGDFNFNGSSGLLNTYCTVVNYPAIDFTVPQINELYVLTAAPFIIDFNDNPVINDGSITISIEDLGSTEGPQTAIAQDDLKFLKTGALNNTGGTFLDEFYGPNDGEFADPMVSTTEGRRIRFDGTLAVREDYTLGGSASIQSGGRRPTSLTLEEGASLNVLSGATLTIEGAVISGCSGLWNSVTVENGGTLILKPLEVMDGAFTYNFTPTIRDAVSAINVEDGGTVILHEAHLVNNIVGITVAESVNEINGQNVTIEVLGTLFEQRRESISGRLIELKPNANNLVNTFAGAEINDVRNKVLFSNAGTVLNNFRNMENGIVFRRSIARVNGTIFEDMFDGNGQYSNNGIVVDDNISALPSFAINPVTIGSGNPNEPTSFQNMETAVLLDHNTWTHVWSTTMDEVRWGIFGDFVGQLRMNENIITSTVAGLQVNERFRPTEQLIFDNTFNAQDEGIDLAFGVLVNSMAIGTLSPNPMFIQDNQFNLEGADFGVRAENTHGLTVRGNTFNWVGNMYGSDAISIQGGSFGRVSNNLIEGNTGQSFTDTRGVDVNGSDFFRVFCNTLDDIENGIWFFGDNENSLVAGNNFKDNAIGLHLGVEQLGDENATFIGLQNHKANRWTGSYLSGFGAVHESNVANVVDQSRFTLSTAGGNMDYNTTVDPFFWFVAVPNKPSSGVFECPTGPPSTPEPIRSEYVDEVINNLYPTIGDWESNYWAPDYTVYRAYRQGDLNNISEDIDFIDWLNEINTGDIPAYYDIEEDLAELFIFDNYTQVTYDTLVSSIVEQADSLLTAYDMLYGASATDSTTLLSQIDSLERELETSHDLTFFAQLDSTVQSRLPGITSQNNALLADSLFKTNIKEVNECLLQYLSSGTNSLTSLQLGSMVSIANQCPLDGGKAVYAARSLVSKLIGVVEFDDATLCSPPPALNPIGNDPNRGNVTIYPNPTTGFVTLQSETSRITGVRVIDGFGRVLLQRRWSEGSAAKQSVNVSDLPNGVYNFELTTQGGEVSVERVIVQ